MELPKKLLDEITKRGITETQLTHQLLSFIKGTPKINLAKPATLNDGIYNISNFNANEYIRLYNKTQKKLKIAKFVPASGMATRMFKSLLEFYNTKITNTTVKYFFNNLHKFPFYKDVIIEFNKLHPSIKKLDTLQNKLSFLDFLLNEKHLNYKNLPKGLIKFHQYDIDNKTAIEEHIDESVLFANCLENNIYIHFTVNPEFIEPFKNHVQNYIQLNYENEPYQFHIDFSVQKPSTDTIAVNENNTPYTNHEGNYLFRPGGHGALIENLNDLDADLIFIKNIDNVCHQNHIKETVHYKEILGGLLIKIKETTHKYLLDLTLNNANIPEIIKFIQEHFKINLSQNSTEKEIFEALNKPIRICGMIPNQGDSGGGPFWVYNHNNELQLQIIESAQIDFKNKQQKEIAFNATHFNPVDIVCSVKDFNNSKFDLTQFVNHDSNFITRKSVNGITIKALELPGLWNGSMDNWLSIFVEIPIETFNPVKSVTDLLAPMHQA